MPVDLQSMQITVAILVGILTILGVIFGWFQKGWKWIATAHKSHRDAGLIHIPDRTLILIPVSRENALWWHMGSVDKAPAMQIVGDLNVTNVSTYGVFVMGAKLRKPKASGHVVVRAHDQDIYSSRHIIPSRVVSDLRFDFFVQPPVRKEGEAFYADVAIIDQFGNEHWLKGLEFRYM